MSKSTDIVKRFLKQNKPDDYHLITKEVHDAINEIIKENIYYETIMNKDKEN